MLRTTADEGDSRLLSALMEVVNAVPLASQSSRLLAVLLEASVTAGDAELYSKVWALPALRNIAVSDRQRVTEKVFENPSTTVWSAVFTPSPDRLIPFDVDTMRPLLSRLIERLSVTGKEADDWVLNSAEALVTAVQCEVNVSGENGKEQGWLLLEMAVRQNSPHLVSVLVEDANAPGLADPFKHLGLVIALAQFRSMNDVLNEWSGQLTDQPSIDLFLQARAIGFAASGQWEPLRRLVTPLQTWEPVKDDKEWSTWAALVEAAITRGPQQRVLDCITEVPVEGGSSVRFLGIFAWTERLIKMAVAYEQPDVLSALLVRINPGSIQSATTLLKDALVEAALRGNSAVVGPLLKTMPTLDDSVIKQALTACQAPQHPEETPQEIRQKIGKAAADALVEREWLAGKYVTKARDAPQIAGGVRVGDWAEVKRLLEDARRTRSGR
jgi:hypothetical protein